MHSLFSETFELSSYVCELQVWLWQERASSRVGRGVFKATAKEKPSVWSQVTDTRMQNPSPLVPSPSPSPSSPQPWLSPSQLLSAHPAVFMLEQQALHRYIHRISGSAVSPRVWTDADCLHAQLGTAGIVINSISSLRGKDRTFP